MSNINLLFTAIALTLLSAPCVVAMLAYKTSKTMPEEKLDVRRIVRYWTAWSVTVIAGIGLIILQWHEFSLFSVMLYAIAGAVVAMLSICVLIVAASGPA